MFETLSSFAIQAPRFPVILLSIWPVVSNGTSIEKERTGLENCFSTCCYEVNV
jgi:hypothetical protein